MEDLLLAESFLLFNLRLNLLLLWEETVLRGRETYLRLQEL